MLSLCNLLFPLHILRLTTLTHINSSLLILIAIHIPCVFPGWWTFKFSHSLLVACTGLQKVLILWVSLGYLLRVGCWVIATALCKCRRFSFCSAKWFYQVWLFFVVVCSLIIPSAECVVLANPWTGQTLQFWPITWVWNGGSV